MKEFQAGQEVRCIDNDGAEGFLSKSEVYVVRDPREGSADLYLNGFVMSWNKRRFEPVEAEFTVDPHVTLVFGSGLSLKIDLTAPLGLAVAKAALEGAAKGLKQ